MSAVDVVVPEGFETLQDHSPFQVALGQMYYKLKPRGAIVGLRIAEQHLNRYRNLHGGALSAFLDVAMGLSVLVQPDGPPANLTVSLNIDYLDRTAKGDWLEADVSISKMGRRLAFVGCEVHAQGRMVARASGVWMLQWPKADGASGA